MGLAQLRHLWQMEQPKRPSEAAEVQIFKLEQVRALRIGEQVARVREWLD